MGLARSMTSVGVFLTVAGLVLLVLPGPGAPLLVLGLIALVVGFVAKSTHRGQA